MWIEIRNEYWLVLNYEGTQYPVHLTGDPQDMWEWVHSAPDILPPHIKDCIDQLAEGRVKQVERTYKNPQMGLDNTISMS